MTDASINPEKAIRIALVSNFTLGEYLLPQLQDELEHRSIPSTYFVVPSSEAMGHIVDPDSPLYAFQPDFIMVVFDGPWLDAHSDGTINGMWTYLIGALEQLSTRTNAYLIVHNLETRFYHRDGAWSMQSPQGYANRIYRLNAQLAEWIADRPRTYLFDFAGAMGYMGEQQGHDPKLKYLMGAEISLKAMPFLAQAYLHIFLPVMGIVSKCLVVDLDDTLWGGVLGEDGIEGLRLDVTGPGLAFRAFHQCLLDLRTRGILLALCSKNNHDEAVAALETHPHALLRPNDFAAMRINWQDKAANLREIAQELYLGLDSLAFFDDNPVERELVRQMLPQVLVIEVPPDPARYVQAVQAIPELDRVELTTEDRARNEMYQTNRQREQYQQHCASLDEYLAGLETVMRFVPATATMVPRITQLSQRTNQFNMTTVRLDHPQVSGLVTQQPACLYATFATDRFGDAGMVGYAVLREDDQCLELENLVLSCRVLGRGLEQALLAAVAAVGLERGLTTLRALYQPTVKNQRFAAFFPEQGLRTLSLVEEGGAVFAGDCDELAGKTPAWIMVEREKLHG